MQRSVETIILENPGAVRELGEAKVSDVGVAKVILRGRQRDVLLVIW